MAPQGLHHSEPRAGGYYSLDIGHVRQEVTEQGISSNVEATKMRSADLDDGLVEGGEMDVYSLGLNWWLTRSSQLGLNYRVVGLDRYGEKGWSSGFDARVILILD